MFDQYSHSDKTEIAEERNQPESVFGQRVGMLPFIIPILLFLVMNLFLLISPTTFYTNEWFSSLLISTILLVYLVAYVIGWKQGFPRWWYAYPATLVMTTLLMQNATSPGVAILGFRSDDAVWGWRAWVPLIIATFLAVAISSSSGTYRKLWQGIWHDPTRLSFLFYGTLPFWSVMIFDEVADKVTTPVMLISFMLFFVGAFFYLRTNQYWLRVAFLFGTAFITFLLQFVVLGIYWTGRQEFWLNITTNWKEQISGATFGLFMLTLVLLFPAMLLEISRIFSRRNRINPNFSSPANSH
ncbi:hypothetical protein EG832_17695 [bacterium]|nr:hypothetical protein [bacterium]